MPDKNIQVVGSPGIVRDTPAHMIGDSAFSDAENVRFNENGAETFQGDLDTFSAASITPLWLAAFPPITAPIWVYGNLTEMWTVENTTHTEITRASGDYSGIATERWQAAVFNGVGIFNNTVDLPQAWTSFSASTPLIDLTNWPATRRCKSLRPFKNFLIALNMTDSGVNRPYRILWSDSADAGTLPGSWDSTDPATDSREFDLAQTSDYLVDQLDMGDINIVYKENSAWGMQYIGPPNFFRFWKILSEKGLLYRDCVANVPFGHAVVTQDDIIVHSGQVEQYESVVDNNWRKWLFSTLDPTNFRNSFLLVNPKKDEMYFCFPELGETYATLAMVWNWSDKSIGVRELDSVPFGAVGPLGDAITDDKEWGV